MEKRGEGDYLPIPITSAQVKPPRVPSSIETIDGARLKAFPISQQQQALLQQQTNMSRTLNSAGGIRTMKQGINYAGSQLTLKERQTPINGKAKADLINDWSNSGIAVTTPINKIQSNVAFDTRPMLQTQQISRGKMRGLSAAQQHYRTPSRGGIESGSQFPMQRGPSYHGMLNQHQIRAARAQTGSGQRRFLIKEERELQKALLSIQNFANNNLRDSYSATAPQTPSYYNSMMPPSIQKAQKLQQLARRQRPSQEYNFVNQKPQSEHQGRSKLFSPKEGAGSYNNFRAKTSAGEMRSNSHSRSKSPQDDISLQFSSTQKMFTDFQRGGELGLENELRDQVKVQQLLVNNNYSAMLKRVGHVKKNADIINAQHQSQLLVSTLHQNMQDQVFKGQNTQVLNNFVAETDANIEKKRSQIFKDDVWQIKNYVIKNIKTKIYHAEMVPPHKKNSTGDIHLQDQAATKGLKGSISPMRSMSGERGSQSRAMSAFGKHRGKSVGKFTATGERGRRQDSVENSRKLQEERDNSYEKYISSMANRVNMQQQISQNRIRVNYVTEGVNTLKSREDSMMNYDTILGTTKDLHLDSISTIRTTDDMFSPKLSQAAEFEERLIQDFVSERENFIQQHKKKNRLIFNMQNSGTQINMVDLGQMTVAEFLKNNKINPKIYLTDTHPDGFSSHQNKRDYLLSKSIHLLQTLKIKQARTFLITAVRDFPFDSALLFNKGLVYMLNQEFAESARIFTSLLARISHRNLVMVNLFQCLLQMKEYERVMDLVETINVEFNSIQILKAINALYISFPNH